MVTVLSPVTFVGEVNPHGTDPRYALYHEPRHTAGGRLFKLLGLRRLDYHRLRRENLCTGAWDSRLARARAEEICDDLRPVVVLLGRRVARAFGLGAHEAFSACRREDAPTRFVFLPHPSGLCREWNDPSAVGRARRLLELAAPGVPWGSRRSEE